MIKSTSFSALFKKKYVHVNFFKKNVYITEKRKPASVGMDKEQEVPKSLNLAKYEGQLKVQGLWPALC